MVRLRRHDAIANAVERPSSSSKKSCTLVRSRGPHERSSVMGNPENLNYKDSSDSNDEGAIALLHVEDPCCHIGQAITNEGPIGDLLTEREGAQRETTTSNTPFLWEWACPL